MNDYQKLEKAINDYMDCQTVAWSKLDLIFCRTNIVYYVLIFLSVIAGIFFGLYPQNRVCLIFFIVLQLLQLLATATINDRKKIQEKAIYEGMLFLLNDIEKDRGIDITDYMH